MTEHFYALLATPLGALFVFVFGLIWGSFFNVVILRLPEDKTLVSRSQCPKCFAKIAWYDNVPLLSYVLLRARCRGCRAPISIQYPLVELGTALLFVFSLYWFGPSLRFFLSLPFVSVLLVISVIDLYLQIIPDELSLPGIGVGFLSALALRNITVAESLLGILLGGGSFFLVAWAYEKFSGREGLGGGDVKLLAMIGAWLGYKSLLTVVVTSSALGSVVGIFMMMRHGRDLKTAIPFGPFLAIGALVHLYFGPQIDAFLYPDLSQI